MLCLFVFGYLLSELRVCWCLIVSLLRLLGFWGGVALFFVLFAIDWFCLLRLLLRGCLVIGCWVCCGCHLLFLVVWCFCVWLISWVYFVLLGCCIGFVFCVAVVGSFVLFGWFCFGCDCVLCSRVVGFVVILVCAIMSSGFVACVLLI